MDLDTLTRVINLLRNPNVISYYWNNTQEGFEKSTETSSGCVLYVILRVERLPFNIRTPDISNVYCRIRFSDSTLQHYIPIYWVT